MEDMWDGYTREELEELDDEWEDFCQEMENNSWEYETG